MNFKDKLALVQELESQRQKRQEEATELRIKLDEVSRDFCGACGLYYSIKRACIRSGNDFDGTSYADTEVKELHTFLGEYLRSKGVLV